MLQIDKMTQCDSDKSKVDFSLTSYHDINTLNQHLKNIQSLLKHPPQITMNNFQEVKKNSLKNWKDQVYYILLLNKINPVWVLDIINPTPDIQTPRKVYIQFISHCIQVRVHCILQNYIKQNKLKDMSVTF